MGLRRIMQRVRMRVLCCWIFPWDSIASGALVPVNTGSHRRNSAIQRPRGAGREPPAGREPSSTRAPLARVAYHAYLAAVAPHTPGVQTVIFAGFPQVCALSIAYPGEPGKMTV